MKRGGNARSSMKRQTLLFDSDIFSWLSGLPAAEAGSPPIIGLFTGAGSKLPTIVQCLIGRGKVRPPYGAQIALKFPSPSMGEPDGDRKHGGKAWHVDGFGHGEHSPFTVLVGVCLSGVPSPGWGNFAVHPGTHWQLQDQVKRTVAAGETLFSDMDPDARKPDLGEPVQMLMEAGDIVGQPEIKVQLCM